jgi:hypothetical protein
MLSIREAWNSLYSLLDEIKVGHEKLQGIESKDSRHLYADLEQKEEIWTAWIGLMDAASGEARIVIGEKGQKLVGEGFEAEEAVSELRGKWKEK